LCFVENLKVCTVLDTLCFTQCYGQRKPRLVLVTRIADLLTYGTDNGNRYLAARNFLKLWRLFPLIFLIYERNTWESPGHVAFYFVFVCRWNMVTIIRLFVKIEGNDIIMGFSEIRGNVMKTWTF